MKYTWTEEDIIPGRFVCKNRKFDKPTGNSAKWTSKIGFLPTAKGTKYCLISMTDGMVNTYESKQELADSLNQNEMMPMPHEWLVETINYLRDCYEHQ